MPAYALAMSRPAHGLEDASEPGAWQQCFPGFQQDCRHFVLRWSAQTPPNPCPRKACDGIGLPGPAQSLFPCVAGAASGQTPATAEQAIVQRYALRRIAGRPRHAQTPPKNRKSDGQGKRASVRLEKSWGRYIK